MGSKIIPHFLAYPLQGSKALNFHDFALAVALMAQAKHLTSDGLAQIQSLVANMNKARTFNAKFNYLAEHAPSVNAEYVQGFVDGEGHFAVVPPIALAGGGGSEASTWPNYSNYCSFTADRTSFS